MKVTLQEIESALDELSGAVIRTKEARRIAKKVYGNDSEVSFHLKIAYGHVQNVVKILESRGEAI